jgi:hypothetical protein
MSTNENLAQPNENSSEQAITIQPSSIATYAGAGDWLAAGGKDAAQDATGALALLHAVRRHWVMIVAAGLACGTLTFCLLFFGEFWKKYKAEAFLQLNAANPTVLGKPTADQAQQIQNEFEIFRDNQQALLKSRFVIIAAMRDAKLKALDSFQGRKT